MLFHFVETLFHLLFEVGFNVSETFLQFLVVIQAQAFFLDVQTAFVFLLELRFDRGFDLFFPLLEALVLFHAVLFVESGDLPLKSKVQLMSDA